MKKVKVAVFYCASNMVEVEVPKELEGDELHYYVQMLLKTNLPEVHNGSSFEFAMDAQLEGEEETFDIG